MTTPSETTTTEAEPYTDSGTTEVTDTAAEQQETPNANSEAARYRVERNEARAARDALAERVAGFQRRDAERVVEHVLEQPTDLWDIGRCDIAEFIDDGGNLLEDEIRAAAAALLDQRPGLAKQQKFNGPRSWGQTSGAPPVDTSSSWSQVVKGR